MTKTTSDTQVKISILMQKKKVQIEFGREVRRLEMGIEEAEKFAAEIIRAARLLECAVN